MLQILLGFHSFHVGLKQELLNFFKSWDPKLKLILIYHLNIYMSCIKAQILIDWNAHI